MEVMLINLQVIYRLDTEKMSVNSLKSGGTLDIVFMPFTAQRLLDNR